ncbi:MAG: winged helix-turn-helix domain-containing protein [Clostridia bacterium]|nr:winged helix-turn-helix domain-containing protein [Clostridia bacterium]
MRDIAIISQNKELSRLIELEALSCGASCRVLTRIPADTSGYEMIFIDADTVAVSNQLDVNVTVAITEKQESAESLADKYNVVLEYPFLLAELRSVILNMSVSVGGELEKNKAYPSVLYADCERREIEFSAHKLSFSEYEFRILCRLCATPREAVSRAELDSLLESDGGNMTDVYICHLRKKFEPLTRQKVIYTVRGVGYMTEYSMEWI